MEKYSEISTTCIFNDSTRVHILKVYNILKAIPRSY